MSRIRWNVSFSPVALQDKYKIPRGEAALFRDAVAELYDTAKPAGAEPVPGIPNTFIYARSRYLIAYETILATRTHRVLYFERE
jgi:hypothetical protein